MSKMIISSFARQGILLLISLALGTKKALDGGRKSGDIEASPVMCLRVAEQG